VSAELFVDTSAWLAVLDTDDANHSTASSVYPNALKSYRHLVTTNLIIAESYILIRRNLGHREAVTFLDRIKISPRIEKVYADAELEGQAEEILRRYHDQLFSYTDAVSFALMHQRNIEEAFTFDRHFTVAGFMQVPA
jgi:predicted nucleic acid-binding protein